MISDNKKVKVTNTKAADPGLCFNLIREDDAGNPIPFDSRLVVKLAAHGIGIHESEAYLKNKVVENELDFILPFGDAEWYTELQNQTVLDCHISVEFLDVLTPPDNKPYVYTLPVVQVPAQFAEFIVSLQPGTTLPPPGMPSGSGQTEKTEESISALTHFINGFRALFGLSRK